jgi:hypothetical protein
MSLQQMNIAEMCVSDPVILGNTQCHIGLVAGSARHILKPEMRIEPKE